MAKSEKKQQLFKGIRLVILIAILVFTTTLGILHQVLKTAKPAGVDAFCPFGGLESLVTLVVTGTMVQRIALSSFILLIAVVISALIFRRTFCGNICALGALQELFGRLGKVIFKKQFTVPAPVDKIARYLKYLLLVVIMVFSFIAGSLIIRPYDPWAAYQHLFAVDLFAEFLIGFIVLIVVLAASLLYDRFFCKYLCPMGAAAGLLGKAGWFRITRNTETCIDCGACDKACPVNIKVSAVKQVTTAECINCNECVNSCPVKDTLEVRGGKKAVASPLVVLLVTLLIFGGVVGTASFAGSFEWGVASLETQIKKAGALNVADIKGSMSFKEVAAAAGLTQEQFMAEFKITDEEFGKAIKDVKGKYGFEVEDVREFVRKLTE